MFREEAWVYKFFEKYGKFKGTLFIVLVVWVPLVVLSFISDVSPFLDLATNIRFLVSLPLLIYAHADVEKKIDWVLENFLVTRIIREEEKPEFLGILSNLDRVSHSRLVKFIFFVFVYSLSFYFFFFSKSLSHISWRSIAHPAGWWFHLVSQPLFWFVAFRFMFKVLLIVPLFVKICRLKLHLEPGYADQMGGLSFLNRLLFAFQIPCFALSCSIAAGAANLILFGKLSLPGLKILTLCFAGLLLLLFAGPFLLFLPKLIKAKIEGVQRYRAVAIAQLEAFNEKWVEIDSTRSDHLSIQDFSALVDYSEVMARIHRMRIIPLRLKDLVGLVLAIGLPFLPVFSLELPWKVIFSQMLNVLR